MTHECFSCDHSITCLNNVNPHQSLVNQLDGNVSLSSELFSASSSSDQLQAENISSTENKIPIFFGNRPPKPKIHDLSKPPHFLRTIRRDNKAVQGISLPVISSYNMRSIFPKLDSYAEDFNERAIGLSFLSEIWEKSSNKKHQLKLQELFELKGILYISTPRPGSKRGGGVAITADPSKFSLTKLNISIPHKLEVSWGLLKPRLITGSITKILCCAFYSPPKSKKKTKLIDHISLSLQQLLLDHPGAGVLIAGGRNDLSKDRLLSIDPSLRQIV